MLRLFRRSGRERAVDELYATVVAQARQPHFYAAWDVPDTAEGRFEMIALHAFLLLRRLKAERQRTATLAQDFFDLMFADLDRNLREMGIGDTGIGKRVKAMAQSFYGRIAAYDAGLADGDAALGDPLIVKRRSNFFYRKGIVCMHVGSADCSCESCCSVTHLRYIFTERIQPLLVVFAGARNGRSTC